MSGHEPDAVRLGAACRRFQRSIVARARQEPRSSKAHCKRSTRKCPGRVGDSWYIFGMDVSNGRLGRVRHVDGSRVYANVAGGLAWFDWSEADSLRRGQVILMPEEGPPEIVADELWVAGNDTGSVRAVTDEVALIEVDGKLRSFAHRSGQPWRTGQTVLIEDDGTPGEAILDDPVDRFGIGESREFDVESLLRGSDLDITLEDFGGNPHLVRRARQLVDAALDLDGRYRAIGAKPIKGVLFAGPAGTGKTFLAQALANYAEANFYNIGGPELVDQYVGQSERRLREVFEHAHANRPSILFFDEVDSMFSQRADDTPEYANRLVGQFLSLLDGFRAHGGVMVIATTNLPGRLDRALLRPGRFGHEIAFELPDETARREVLQASSRRLRFSTQVDLEGLAGETAGWSSADLASIWTEAALMAHADGRDSLCDEDVFGAHSKIKAAKTQRTTSQSIGEAE